MKVFFGELGDAGYERPLKSGLEWVGFLSQVGRGDRIFIKPNLTYPSFRPGVMTNPEAVEALVRLLVERTDRVTICESDSGGYNPFSMDEVFRVTGLAQMARKLGVRVVNLSQEASTTIAVKSGWRRLRVPLPRVVLKEADWFISMPVPKVHLNTKVSLAIKNQWGVIQEPAQRLKLHPYFRDVIHAVTEALPRPLAVMDGRFGLTRSGPMRGDVVELNWLLVSDSLYACDYHALRLMGLDYRRIGYLREIFLRTGADRLANAELNCDWRHFRRGEFYLKRRWTDYPGLLTFNSRALAYVGYESGVAKPLHWLLYKFREPFY